MAQDWWKNYFGKEYIETYQQAGFFDTTSRQANFLVKNVFPKKAHNILDLCCGHGRHSIALAKKGYNVTGLDYSAYAIKLAKTEARQKKLDINFITGDARNFKLGKKFDVVINMFTAFGYGSRDEDRKIIKNAAAVLKINGVFFIDLMSLPWLWRNFKPVSRQRLDGYIVVAKRKFDFVDNLIRETRIITQGKKSRKLQNHNRFYTLPELTELLRNEGLRVTKSWGTFLGKPYGFDSKRMLVAAIKHS